MFVVLKKYTFFTAYSFDKKKVVKKACHSVIKLVSKNFDNMIYQIDKLRQYLFKCLYRIQC